MNGRRALAVTRRLLQQLRRDRRTVALVFVAPLLVITLLWALVRHPADNTGPRVALVNQDGGPLGAEVLADRSRRLFFQGGVLTEQQAEAELRAARLDGYVVFPADFSSQAAAGRFDERIRLEGGQQFTRSFIAHELETILFEVALRHVPGGPSAVPFDRPTVTYLHGSSSLDSLDYLGAAFIGVVVFFLVFVVTSVVFLRERTQGTLERLMASPMARSELVLGYSLAFGMVALAQSLVVLVYSLAVLHVYSEGNPVLVFALTGLMGLGAANLGIFLSVFARTEFQAVQFIPLVIAPQLLLAGLIFPVEAEPGPLRLVSDVLPLTYGIRGLREVMIRGAGLGSGEVQLDLLVLLAFAILAVVAGSASLRRRVA